MKPEVESEYLQSQIIFALCCLSPHVELFPFINVLMTGVALHVEGSHYSLNELPVAWTLCLRDLRWVEVWRVVLLKRSILGQNYKYYITLALESYRTQNKYYIRY